MTNVPIWLIEGSISFCTQHSRSYY